MYTCQEEKNHECSAGYSGSRREHRGKSRQRPPSCAECQHPNCTQQTGGEPGQLRYVGDGSDKVAGRRSDVQLHHVLVFEDVIAIYHLAVKYSSTPYLGALEFL